MHATETLAEIVRGFTATMLEDLQHTENDEALAEGREARNIDRVAGESGERIGHIVADFLARAEPYLAPSNYSLTYDLYVIGSDLYLTAAGHGVGFWDRPEKINRRDGEIISSFVPRIETIVGDDGLAYLC